jgi:hypothetical protein
LLGNHDPDGMCTYSSTCVEKRLKFRAHFSMPWGN